MPSEDNRTHGPWRPSATHPAVRGADARRGVVVRGAVTLPHAPTAVKVVVLIIAVPVALVGFGMTFRDLS